MQLYFIRHGQSINNANTSNETYKEHSDPYLTEIGKQQAKFLAAFLKERQTITDPDLWNSQNRHGFGFTHIYASLMERATPKPRPTLPAHWGMSLFQHGWIFMKKAVFLRVKKRTISKGWQANRARSLSKTFPK
jgi:bisphosphoglycerate-dependent phosphoglycerate mutase